MKVLAFCIIIWISIANAANPGYKARLTKAGLDYAEIIGAAEVSTLILTSNIPTISFSSGKITGSVEDIKIDTFDSETWSYVLVAPNQVSISMNNAHVIANGKFHGKVDYLIPISVSGDVKATASQSSLQIKATLSKDGSGRPTVHETGCSADIGDFSLDLSGSFGADILNLFHSLIEKSVKPQIADTLCSEAQTAINTNLAQILAKMPTLLPFGDDFSIDYTLTEDPTVANSYIEISGRGDIRYKKSADAPFDAPPLDVSKTSTSKMLYFWGSQYILNTWAYQAHEAGILSLVVNRETVPGAAKYLATNCSLLCIGTIIKELAQKYPNTYADIKLATNARPQLVISSKNITLTGAGNVILSVEEPSGLVQIATAVITITADVVPVLNGTVITGTTKINYLNITQTSSILTQPIPWEFFQNVAKNELQEQINKLLSTGIPIPSIDGISLQKALLTLEKNTMVIGADFTYKPLTE